VCQLYLLIFLYTLPVILLMFPESSLNMKEENYLYLGVAGLNTLLCLFVACKAIHVFVGVISFVCTTLLLIGKIYIPL